MHFTTRILTNAPRPGTLAEEADSELTRQRAGERMTRSLPPGTPKFEAWEQALASGLNVEESGTCWGLTPEQARRVEERYAVVRERRRRIAVNAP